MSAILEVRDFSVDYGKVRALHDASLRVEAGRIATVIGPNGAGKSTLLNAIMGVLPSSGDVRFAGRIERGSIASRLADGMSLVPEKRELFGAMTVEDNLLLGGYVRLDLRGRGAADTQEEVFRLFPRLKERRKQLAGTLSGGERQMLAIARALMSQPRLLLLDEPSLGLAPLVTREIFRIVRELNEKDGLTVLVVEQNAAIALEVASHAYVLEVGKVAVSGTSEELGRDESVRKSYLGY
jgi:branched-chain amino acid transport system ATP-binding protein